MKVNPETLRWEDLSPTAVNLRATVLRYICVHGGATCEEVEHGLDRRHTSISARITELQELGKIRDSGMRRLNESGCKARVYIKTTAEEEARIVTAPKLHNHIYIARKYVGISIADLAAETGISPKRLALIEEGKRRPKPEEAFEIGFALSNPPPEKVVISPPKKVRGLNLGITLPDALVMGVAKSIGLMDFLEGIEE